MIIICGKTIAEVERDLEMAKRAIATGAPMGIGGATIADVEKAMAMLKGECGAVTPISNPNYTPPCGPMSCDHCNYDHCPCDDEDEVEYCPVCDCELDEDGYCDNCGYPDEDEDEDEDEDIRSECGDYCEDGLSEKDIDRILDALGIPKTLYDLVRRELGL